MLVDHIYHGDCREVLAALPERSVDLIFADPPYLDDDETETYLLEALLQNGIAFRFPESWKQQVEEAITNEYRIIPEENRVERV